MNNRPKELRSFAYGIQMVQKGVQNSIALDTFKGIAEGLVNKLKEVMRVMYGRASRELLTRNMKLRNLASTKLRKNHYFQDDALFLLPKMDIIGSRVLIH